MVIVVSIKLTLFIHFYVNKLVLIFSSATLARTCGSPHPPKFPVNEEYFLSEIRKGFAGNSWDFLHPVLECGSLELSGAILKKDLKKDYDP